MTVRKGWLAVAVAALLIAVVCLAAFSWPVEKALKHPLGLFTSLPIYWSERASVNEALDGGGAPHWARAFLEKDYRLVPLDTLDEEQLAGLRELVMAQPRPLAPQENVALDSWVRNGGRLLLFADPFLTEESRFPLGDKRRPQDVVLLSPILARWGLELTFDDGQADGERAVAYRSSSLPERLAGRLRLARPGAPAECSLAAEGLLAECAVGKGRVLVMADAAILEADRSPESAEPALSELLENAFAR